VRRKKRKVQVKFDPYQPLYFLAYVDNTDKSKFFVSAVRRTLLPYDIELKVKPLQPGAPTPSPALFVQGKYFFCYAENFRPSELESFIRQVQAIRENLSREFVSRHSGSFIVAVRPLYDKDRHRYPGRYQLLLPSETKLGFMTFESRAPGIEVTPFLLEALHQMGVNYITFPSSHTAPVLRVYVGPLRVQED